MSSHSEGRAELAELTSRESGMTTSSRLRSQVGSNGAPRLPRVLQILQRALCDALPPAARMSASESGTTDTTDVWTHGYQTTKLYDGDVKHSLVTIEQWIHFNMEDRMSSTVQYASSGPEGLSKSQDIETAHIERHSTAFGDDVKLAQHNEVAKETAFVGLSKLQTIKKFWRAALFCYM